VGNAFLSRFEKTSLACCKRGNKPASRTDARFPAKFFLLRKTCFHFLPFIEVNFKKSGDWSIFFGIIKIIMMKSTDFLSEPQIASSSVLLLRRTSSVGVSPDTTTAVIGKLH
jgi:hypothetical protein